MSLPRHCRGLVSEQPGVLGMAQGRGDALSLHVAGHEQGPSRHSSAPARASRHPEIPLQQRKEGSQWERWRKIARTSQELNTLRKCQQPPLPVCYHSFSICFSFPQPIILEAGCPVGTTSELTAMQVLLPAWSREKHLNSQAGAQPGKLLISLRKS